MPERYHIHTVPTPHRFRRVGKFGTSDWREDCSRCKNCVKLRCLYDNVPVRIGSQPRRGGARGADL